MVTADVSLQENNMTTLLPKTASQPSKTAEEDIRPVEEKYFLNSSVATAYDNLMFSNVPFYGDLIRYVVEQISTLTNNAPLRILEIGAGTANISLQLSAQQPKHKIGILDHSRAMLNVAKSKFTAKALPTPRCYHASFEHLHWMQQTIHFPYSAVVASLTLDHIHSDRALGDILQSTHDMIKPGGLFVLAEKCCNGRNKLSPSWKSFGKMVDIRRTHMIEHRLKTKTQSRAWKKHITTEDCLRPLSDFVVGCENVGFKILNSAGVILPEADELNDRMFYDLQKVRTITRGDILKRDRAYAVAILVCQRPIEEKKYRPETIAYVNKFCPRLIT